MSDKLSRYGHRERMRKQYIADGFEGMPDYNVLELFLSVIIPQKDVKPIAYDLINYFGSLENVINADILDLMSVKGVGEATAIELKLIADINKRISVNKNNDVTHINSLTQAISFCKNILAYEQVERVLVVTLDSTGGIICHRLISKGTVNGSNAPIREIVGYALRDNASGILIAHNHPKGEATPSANDINYTINLKATLRKINIQLIDHIIIGAKDNISLAHTSEFASLTFS